MKLNLVADNINLICIGTRFLIINVSLYYQFTKCMILGQNFAIGGRNINREVDGGDWRWVKNGSFSKMSYFAFGPKQPIKLVKSFSMP